MLKGEAKKRYQREYMRRRRGSNRSNNYSVRPSRPKMGFEVKPAGRQFDADGNPLPEY